MNEKNWIKQARDLLIEKAVNGIIPFQNYIELERNVKHTIISYGLLFAAQKEQIFEFIHDLVTSQKYAPKELKKRILLRLRTFFSTYIK
ncbi:MAG: hypothetical protein ACOC44_03810 [Promethearchaeia archaeon]